LPLAALFTTLIVITPLEILSQEGRQFHTKHTKHTNRQTKGQAHNHDMSTQYEEHPNDDKPLRGLRRGFKKLKLTFSSWT